MSNHQIDYNRRGGITDRNGKPICITTVMNNVRDFWERRGMEVPVGKVPKKTKKIKKRVKVKAHTRNWPQRTKYL